MVCKKYIIETEKRQKSQNKWHYVENRTEMQHVLKTLVSYVCVCACVCV